MLVVAALVLIVFGVAGIAARDVLWDLTEARHRSRGLDSERTPEWDQRTQFGGVAALILGAVVLFVALTG